MEATYRSDQPLDFNWYFINGRPYSNTHHRVCRYCQQGNLTWFKNSLGGQKWVLADYLSRMPHVCSPGKGPRQYTKKAPVNFDEELAPIRKSLEGINNKIADFKEYSAVVATTVAKDIANITAREVIKELVPVEHKIVVTKPNNSKITFSGHPHKKLDLLVNVLSQKLNVMMVGPAGSGKTTAAGLAAKILELPYYEASMGPATSQWDLVGYRSPDGKYIPGILRKPYEEGGLLTLDELDNSNPSVLTALNSAVANGHCAFPDKMVEKHKDFVLVAAGNTYGRGADRLYVGRNQLDAATLDRFVVIDWDYDEEAEFDWAGRDQLEWIKYIQAIRASANRLNLRVIVSPRASIFGAALLRAKMGREEIAEMVLWKGISKDDRTKILSNVRA